jgi:hypothetical protein
MTGAIELEPTANSTDRNLAVGFLHPTHLEGRAHSNLTKKRKKVYKNSSDARSHGTSEIGVQEDSRWKDEGGKR